MAKNRVFSSFLAKNRQKTTFFWPRAKLVTESPFTGVSKNSGSGRPQNRSGTRGGTRGDPKIDLFWTFSKKRVIFCHITLVKSWVTPFKHRFFRKRGPRRPFRCGKRQKLFFYLKKRERRDYRWQKNGRDKKYMGLHFLHFFFSEFQKM
jgi:hypothetical protein